MKFKPSGFSKLWNACGAPVNNIYFDRIETEIEHFTKEELFEPVEPNIPVLEGVECNLRDLKPGDFFVNINHNGNNIESVGYIGIIISNSQDFIFFGYDNIWNRHNIPNIVINLGKLKSIPEKFTVKIKQPELADIANCVCGEKCDTHDGISNFFVFCTNCDYCSPTKQTKQEAIMLHNKMMEASNK